MLKGANKKAFVLINLGTPESPTPQSVRKYLNEFLMDPLVIDLPWIFRWLLLQVVILPRRSHTSAEAYQKIWTDQGSPLRFHLRALVSGVQEECPEWEVLGAMRYGQPSLLAAFEEIQRQGIQKVFLLPLYPQYSLAATESSLRECDRVIRKLQWQGEVQSLSSFFDFPPFIRAFAETIREGLKGFQSDHLLMSFHGLPERHLKKLPGHLGSCLEKPHCCEVNLKTCYRAQCYQTARLIAKELGLSSSDYTVCFQSRLGRTPWIRPHTDELYSSLAQEKGIRRLAVACPSFVADCLETLEEVEIRGRAQWLESGGEAFCWIPSLNASPLWREAIRELVREIQFESDADSQEALKGAK